MEREGDPFRAHVRGWEQMGLQMRLGECEEGEDKTGGGSLARVGG